MKILISGSSGLVGAAVSDALRRDGHTVCRLLRPQSPSGDESAKASAATTDIHWDPISGELNATRAEHADAVVHLAGASIAAGRWTDERKGVLRSSRADATRHLVGALARLREPPAVFVSASAVGYYGNRGEEELTESSAPGNDFLAALSRDWETEATRAETFGARVAILRFGVILSARGGALPRMLVPFRLGLGGKLGSGKQWMPWLALGEAVSAIRFALGEPGARGAINAVTASPVRNRDFTATLGRILRRPTIFPVPEFALRLALGEMADALLLASQRVLPRKLPLLGYRFEQPELEPALAAILRPEG